MSTLSPEERTCELQAALTSHNGQLLVRLGRAAEGVEWLRKSYEINLEVVPPIPQEMAWGLYDLWQKRGTSFLKSLDPTGHAFVSTFTTDGTTLNTFAHYSSESRG